MSYYKVQIFSEHQLQFLAIIVVVLAINNNIYSMQTYRKTGSLCGHHVGEWPNKAVLYTYGSGNGVLLEQAMCKNCINTEFAWIGWKFEKWRRGITPSLGHQWKIVQGNAIYDATIAKGESEVSISHVESLATSAQELIDELTGNCNKIYAECESLRTENQLLKIALVSVAVAGACVCLHDLLTK